MDMHNVRFDIGTIMTYLLPLWCYLSHSLKGVKVKSDIDYYFLSAAVSAPQPVLAPPTSVAPPTVKDSRPR